MVGRNYVGNTFVCKTENRANSNKSASRLTTAGNMQRAVHEVITHAENLDHSHDDKLAITCTSMLA